MPVQVKPKCKWCGYTQDFGTPPVIGDECNSCWELRTRIEDNIELAEKFIRNAKEKRENDQ